MNVGLKNLVTENIFSCFISMVLSFTAKFEINPRLMRYPGVGGTSKVSDT